MEWRWKEYRQDAVGGEECQEWSGTEGYQQKWTGRLTSDVLRPAMLYGLEVMTLTTRQEGELEIAGLTRMNKGWVRWVYWRQSKRGDIDMVWTYSMQRWDDDEDGGRPKLFVDMVRGDIQVVGAKVEDVWTEFDGNKWSNVGTPNRTNQKRKKMPSEHWGGIIRNEGHQSESSSGSLMSAQNFVTPQQIDLTYSNHDISSGLGNWAVSEITHYILNIKLKCLTMEGIICMALSLLYFVLTNL